MVKNTCRVQTKQLLNIFTGIPVNDVDVELDDRGKSCSAVTVVSHCFQCTGSWVKYAFS